MRKTKTPDQKVAAVISKLDGTRPCDSCAGYGYFPNPGTLVGSGRKLRKPCETCEGKGSFPEFTEEDKQLFIQACNNTYSAIAYDLEQANDGRPLSKAAAVECTLDANYMDTYGPPSYRSNVSRDDMVRRLRQIRRSNVAEKWCKQALFG